MVDVIIADDHAITRAGLRTILETTARVVDEAADGLEAVRVTEARRPDVLILDLSLPGLNGLDVLRQVRRRAPATNVVVLSMHSDDAYVVRALQEGAVGYVLKGSDPDELVRAVKHAASGSVYLGRGLPETLRDEALAGSDVVQDRYSTLTDREREVMQLIAEGHTSHEIGDLLFISRRTVDKHRERIMAKLDLSNQTELVRFALQRGIIPGSSTDSPSA